jgi:putative ABC transport system permease protein
VNPLPFLWSQLKLSWFGTALVVLLTALAVALGIAGSLLEHGLRQGSARAADDFDLIIAAPGSQSQVVLSTIFLQPAALPLLPGAVLPQIAAEPGAVFAAPLGFGDHLGRSAIVGTTNDFVATRPLAEGRRFASDEEAVIGAAVERALGSNFEPQHGIAEGENAHGHEGMHYTIVGRLKPTGTAWDRAILVPIEAIWGLHGLSTGHAEGDERIGPPWEKLPAGVPAIVVKPRSIGEAYRLRAKYRTGATMAFFPAEVLVELYGVMGDAREVLSLVAALTQALVLGAVLLAVIAALEARRQRLAVLRALGAPRAFLFTTVWLFAGIITLAGALAGLGLGWLLGLAVAGWVAAETGTVLPIALGRDEAMLLVIVLALGILGGLVPAFRAYRQPVAAALRG